MYGSNRTSSAIEPYKFMDAWFPAVRAPLFTEQELSKVHRCGQLAKKISKTWDLKAEEDRLDKKVDLHT